jgi:glutamate synthase (NADPH/NADH) large chain
MTTLQNTPGLYSPEFEHDACGIGFVAHIKGRKSHQIISDALTVLENMEHRGACGCENNTGDGAGILIQMPHEFLFDECLKLGFQLPAFGRYGVGVTFFPQDARVREECREIIQRCAETLGIGILGYRKVPTDNSLIGETAKSVEPQIEQLFVSCPYQIKDPEEFERKLFVLRHYIAKTVQNTLGKASQLFTLLLFRTKRSSIKGS